MDRLEIAALHLRKTQLAAFNHADEFFNGGLGFGHRVWWFSIQMPVPDFAGEVGRNHLRKG